MSAFVSLFSNSIPTPFFLVGGAVLALAIVGIIFGVIQARKRREALGAIASARGWRFDPSYDPHHDDEFDHFEVFRKGHSRAAYNTLSGRHEIAGQQCRVKMGDFRYKQTSGSGKDRRTTTYTFSYLIAHLPWETPALVIRREGFFDKVAGVFGFDDIDFESAEFSKKFYVKSDDKRFAFDVVHARMMEFLLAENPPLLDIEHGRVCIGGGSRLWRPEQFLERLEFADRFFALWPEHVTKEL